MTTQPVHVSVNGAGLDLYVEPLETLLETLRERVQLSGTKEGCGTGYCGACTVLVDGNAVNACLFLTVDADRREVTTIEGLAHDGAPDAVQTAFVAHGGLQCGFCTPGMILSASALLASNPNPTESEIRSAIVGNICRCTGYQPIVTAIRDAAVQLRAAGRTADAHRPRAQIRSRA